MHSSKDRSALFDIRDNAALARDFVGSLALSDFKADRRAFYAATRALEIISEAARRQRIPAPAGRIPACLSRAVPVCSPADRRRPSAL
jgi:uncharacterized protein with HEPN domain